MLVFCNFTLLSMVIHNDVKRLHHLLRVRVGVVMRRTKGVLVNSSELIQHLNPACRAARQFPHLMVSRILMSLNDYDFPSDLTKTEKQVPFLLKVLLSVLSFFGIVIVILLSFLPEALQETFLDVTVSGAISFAIMTTTTASTIAIVVVVLLVVGVFLLIVLREYLLYQKRKSQVATEDKALDLLDEKLVYKVKRLSRKSIRPPAAATLGNAVLPFETPTVQTVEDRPPPLNEQGDHGAGSDDSGSGSGKMTDGGAQTPAVNLSSLEVPVVSGPPLQVQSWTGVREVKGADDRDLSKTKRLPWDVKSNNQHFDGSEDDLIGGKMPKLEGPGARARRQMEEEHKLDMGRTEDMDPKILTAREVVSANPFETNYTLDDVFQALSHEMDQDQVAATEERNRKADGVKPQTAGTVRRRKGKATSADPERPMYI